MTLLKKLTMPLAIVAGLGLNGCDAEYNREIEGQKVTYLVPNHFFYGPQMKVIKGDTTFTFKNFGGLHKDNYQSEIYSDGPLSEGTLDKVVVRVGEKETKFLKMDADESTLTGRINSAAFARFTPWYNELRNNLRDTLRKEYANDVQGVKILP